MKKYKVLFVTDPLCAWCWGTLPEINKTRALMDDQVSFDLIMGGLRIGPPDGLVEYEIKKLQHLWHEVHQLTRQEFSGKVPDNFVYDSEIACRAVEIARNQHHQL